MGRDRYEGFDAFVHAGGQALTRYAYLLVLDAQLAEDLVQQALLEVASRWSRLKDGNPEAYARKVILNGAASRARRRRVLSEDSVAEPPDRAEKSDATGNLDQRLLFATVLRKLPPRQRAVLVLRYYDDLTEAETAAVMGCSVGNVKSQSHHALARLRQLVPDLMDPTNEVSP